MKKLAVVAVALLTTLADSLPVAAFPVPSAATIATGGNTDILQVQQRPPPCRPPYCRPGAPGRPPGAHPGRPPAPPHHANRPHRPPPPQHGWYNGHRGYRDYHPGYRRGSDGWWYPLAAFGTGLIIGGSIANQPARYSSAHVQWCYDRYKTYRASDNTYAPQVGVRAQCVSPYR